MRGDTTLNDIIYWNTKSYKGNMIIKRRYVVMTLTLICLITPFTNWMIPLLPRIIKNDVTLK